MAELLKTEISIEILNEFCFELGSTKEKYVPDQTILNLKPLREYYSYFSSLNYFIIDPLYFSKAQEYNCLNKLATAINEAAELSSEMSMQKMGSNLLAKLTTNFFY